MKLDKRLELLTALSMLAVGEQEDEQVDNVFGQMIDNFELQVESIPNTDTKTLLLLINAAVIEIQDMIDEYNGFEREEETFH